MSPPFTGAERAARTFITANPDLAVAAPGFRDGTGLIEPAEVLARIERTGMPHDRALVVLMSVVVELRRREVHQ